MSELAQQAAAQPPLLPTPTVRKVRKEHPTLMRVDQKVRVANDRALKRMAQSAALRAEIERLLLQRLGNRVHMIINQMESILKHPTALDAPRVALLNKIMDKFLPNAKPPEAEGGGGAKTPQINIQVNNVERGTAQVAAAYEPPNILNQQSGVVDAELSNEDEDA